MRKAATVSPLRMPVGAFGGALNDLPVEKLGATVTRAAIERTGLDPCRIHDVVLAQRYMSGEGAKTICWNDPFVLARRRALSRHVLARDPWSVGPRDLALRCAGGNFFMMGRSDGRVARRSCCV